MIKQKKIKSNVLLLVHESRVNHFLSMNSLVPDQVKIFHSLLLIDPFSNYNNCYYCCNRRIIYDDSSYSLEKIENVVRVDDFCL